MTHTVYIDIPTLTARAAANLTQRVSVRMTHLSDERLSFAFMTVTGTVAPVADWESGRVVLKLTPGGSVLLLDVSLEDNEEDTTARRYVAEWAAESMDSEDLRALLRDRTTDLICTCEVMWIADGVTRRVAFEVAIAPAYNLPEDGAPPIENPASEGWLDGRAVRFDQVQTLTTEQRLQALANLGVIIAEDGTLTLPTGHWDTFNAPLE